MNKGTVIFFAQSFPTVAQKIMACVVFEQVNRIHDGDHRVELGHLCQRSPIFGFERKGLGDGKRLADAARFDEQVVEAPFVREARDLGQQILAERAAIRTARLPWIRRGPSCSTDRR